jgi:hypothetical protein
MFANADGFRRPSGVFTTRIHHADGEAQVVGRAAHVLSSKLECPAEGRSKSPMVGKPGP